MRGCVQHRDAAGDDGQPREVVILPGMAAILLKTVNLSRRSSPVSAEWAILSSPFPLLFPGVQAVELNQALILGRENAGP